MPVRCWTLAAVMAALPVLPAIAQATPATIPQVVLPAPELSAYATSLTDPRLNARLSGPGPITALVPRDAPLTTPGPVWPTDPQEAAAAARALVVQGRWTPEALHAQARRNNDRLVLSTDTGASLLVAPLASGRVLVVDQDGNTARTVGPLRPAGNGGVIVLDRPLASR